MDDQIDNFICLLIIFYVYFYREVFCTYGQVKSVVVVHRSKCAFVNYATRSAAELAAQNIADRGLNIKNRTLRVAWGRARPQGPRADMKKPGRNLSFDYYYCPYMEINLI